MPQGSSIWFHRFLRCGHCGGRLTLRNNYKRNVSYYGCRASEVMPRLDLLKELVKDEVGSLTLSDEIKAQVKQTVSSLSKAPKTRAKKAALEATQRKVTKQIEELTEKYAMDEVSDEDYAATLSFLKSQQEALLPIKMQGTNINILRPEESVARALKDSEENGKLLQIVFIKLGLKLRVACTGRVKGKSIYTVELKKPTDTNELSPPPVRGNHG